ncbi:MAG TPA: PIN domain-containing protein [Thermoplasmata archaeon]|nr:PIN domain-containing protein [Thermoplasmata archaeon]
MSTSSRISSTKGCDVAWRKPGKPPGDESLPVPSRLIVDANILVAAFLRDSTARRILTLSIVEFSAPALLFEELEPHLPSLRSRAGLSSRQSSELLRLLRGCVNPVSEEFLRPFWNEAKEVMQGIDPRDAAYVAAARAVPCDGIWSDDVHLRRQALVPCWTTKELVLALREGGFDF